MITKIRKRYEDNGYVVYAPEDEMTFCDYCGKPVFSGMTTDDGDCHVHEDCFEEYMDDKYGKGKWKAIYDFPDYDLHNTDEYDGYYCYLDDNNEWNGTGIYYTEWYDDWDVEWNYDKNFKNRRYNFEVIRNQYLQIEKIRVYIGTSITGVEQFKTFYNPTEEEITWIV